MRVKTEATIIKLIEIAIVFSVGGLCGWVLKVWVG